MPLRKNLRLAYCEYVTPNNGNIAVVEARRGLMQSVRRVFPKMLRKLANDVLPAYDALARSGFDIEESLWHASVSPFKKLPQDNSLHTALSTWAREFHAQEEGWFLDEMLRTLRGWYIAPEWLSQLECKLIGVVDTLAMGERFEFDCERWDMQSRNWADYSKLVRERFEKKLKEYEAASRGLAESCGLVRAPRKYSSKNLDWFVHFQFGGLSPAKIANRPGAPAKGMNEDTILKGVKAAARLIDWESLRRKPGRLNQKIR